MSVLLNYTITQLIAILGLDVGLGVNGGGMAKIVSETFVVLLRIISLSMMEGVHVVILVVVGWCVSPEAVTPTAFASAWGEQLQDVINETTIVRSLP